MERVNELCHGLLHVTYVWQSIKYTWVTIVIIYVRNEQFDTHLTLLVKWCTIKNNNGESKIKYFYMG